MPNKVATPIKWTASKRKSAGTIVQEFPIDIGTYYEPFVGGGSVLLALLQSPRPQPKRCVASDVCLDLIRLWLAIQHDPEHMIDQYASLHSRLASLGKTFYYEMRDEYNRTGDPALFLFLTKTCRLGLTRWNRLGKLNSSFHDKRPGEWPGTFGHKIQRASHLVRNVEFLACSYEQVRPEPCDFLYCDPPYDDKQQTFYGGFKHSEFWDWLANIPCKYALTFNGMGQRPSLAPVGVRTVQLNAGASNYEKMRGNDKPIADCMYLSYA